MVSLKILRERGLTQEKLKKHFTTGATEGKIPRLLELIQSRILTGRTGNFEHYRTFLALDLAYNAPFSQTQLVYVQELMNRAGTMSYADALGCCNNLGLAPDNFFYTVTGKDKKPVLDSNGQVIRRLNVVKFFETFIPVCRTYLVARWAKLYNDRASLFPFFRYSPIQFTAENRALCEIITDLIERQTQSLGYKPQLRQVIFQILQYSFVLQFVQEPWYTEMQLTDSEQYTVGVGDTLGKVADRFNVPIKELRKVNENRTKGRLREGEVLNIPPRQTTVKEGLRYETPHPSRCFFDLAYAPTAINSNTGAKFAGHWSVKRYGELNSDPALWNKESIPFGTTDWFNWGNGAARAFWQNVYPCTMKFPTWAGCDGRGSMQRDRQLYYGFQSGTNDTDSPVFVSTLFMKLKPSDYGLADYPYEIWMRFLVANDNTVLYAEPVPYNPLCYGAYDADSNRWPNASMSLEILPFQVHLGNILSQILFTAKQGLRKIVPYDTNQINEDTIMQLENRTGDPAGIQFLKYDSMEARIAGRGPEQMFQPIDLGQHSSAEMASQIPLIIDILERLLGMSSQEVGAAATHEQSATETRVIANNSTTRVDFTGSFVDDFIWAWKQQLYEASMIYMDDEFISQVLPTPETLAALKRMGFDVPESVPGSLYGTDKVAVRGQKQKLVLDGFASDRDGANRINDPNVAAVILQGVQAVVQNPMLAQMVGAPALLDILTSALVLAGAPKDFRLRVDPSAAPQVQAQQLQEQVRQMSEQIMKATMDQVGEALKPMAEAIKGTQEQTQQVAQALAQAQQQTNEQVGQALQVLTQKIEQVTQGLIQNSKQDQQIAGVVVGTKQEADQLAQAVLELKNLMMAVIKQLGGGAPPMQPPQQPESPMAPMI